MLVFRVTLLLSFLSAAVASADPPSASYIFPAGGQRGTSVDVRIGGHYLHDRAAWEMLGLGVKASTEIVRTKRVWFEGPLIRQPASQQKEDYPHDYSGSVQIEGDASPGDRTWRTWNAQGVTPGLRFIVGSLPEVVEQETDGQPIPTQVALPVTINGRIFPREDVDVWTFDADAGQSITCSVEATGLGITAPDQPRLEAQIEVRDANNRAVAATLNTLRADPQLRFVAPSAGKYQVRIWDSKFSGLQHYVYRLTVTAGPWIDAIYPLGGRRGTEAEVEVFGQGIPGNRLKVRWPETANGNAFEVNGQLLNPIACAVDNLPEVLELAASAAGNVPMPGIANGRIEQPGDVDAWSFEAVKGAAFKLEISAAAYGSPLAAVLVVKDSEGKELARVEEAVPGSSDPSLMFTPPADGRYTAEISERFASRGGPTFAYRLKIAPLHADFRLTMPDNLAVIIGGEQKLAVNVERSGGFNAPVRLTLEGLPAGATCAEVEVPANQNKGEMIVKVAKDFPVQIARLKVVGTADVNGTAQRREGVVGSGDAALNHVLLACTLTTPFKFKSQYELRYIARGGTLKKSYTIERNGYEGPLEVSLADRQGRHLQGLSGPTINVPAGINEFDYTVTLPPWMELGRTSRSNLMLVGELAEASGKKHKVSYSTVDQNEQLIALVSPAPLRLSLDKTAIACQQGSQLKVPIHMHCQVGTAGPCRLELIVPAHMRDIAAKSVTVEGNADTAELTIELGANPGPFNMPLLIRGVTERDGGPIVAEVNLELLRDAP